MAEDGHSSAEAETGYGEVPSGEPKCPYNHPGWVFKRYNEYVCGRCGTRIVNFPGVALS